MKGLLLAGDWVDTGLPATIEGAIRSGNKAADLLLQERVPKTVASVYVEDLAFQAPRTLLAQGTSGMRVFTNPSSATVEAHLLSNGRYHVAVTSAGEAMPPGVCW